MVGASLGCTKVDPGFSVLDSNSIPQPLFSGATTTSMASATGNEKFAINGECDFKIRNLTAQIVGVDSGPGTMEHVATGTVVATCQDDGKFSFELKSLNDLGIVLKKGSTYEVQLRGVTTAGPSKPSSIYVRFGADVGPRLAVVSSGGTLSGPQGRMATSTGGGLKGFVRVGNRMPAYDTPPSSSGTMTESVSMGGTMKARMGISAATK